MGFRTVYLPANPSGTAFFGVVEFVWEELTAGKVVLVDAYHPAGWLGVLHLAPDALPDSGAH